MAPPHKIALGHENNQVIWKLVCNSEDLGLVSSSVMEFCYWGSHY